MLIKGIIDTYENTLQVHHALVWPKIKRISKANLHTLQNICQAFLIFESLFFPFLLINASAWIIRGIIVQKADLLSNRSFFTPQNNFLGTSYFWGKLGHHNMGRELDAPLWFFNNPYKPIDKPQFWIYIILHKCIFFGIFFIILWIFKEEEILLFNNMFILF